jgi:two-component system, chemotaxis family, CheB/CheR fusion protein
VTRKVKSAKKVTVKKAGSEIKPFPVVAIGGSAGAIEAFTQLLEALPSNLGMAYIYIQHLSPKHESYLTQIFQRKTKLKVIKIKDDMELKKDCLFVLPANHELKISNGRLKLIQYAKNSNRHYPIDYFFSSLASEYKQNVIGIILSGTGSDGSYGLMSIKSEGGVTFAQDDSAQHHGMPTHATEMGYVDFVMPPKDIARELMSLIKHPYSITTQNEFQVENKEALHKIHVIMHRRRGVDFSHYKQTTINRRIFRRMVLNRLKSLDDYASLLNSNKAEADLLYQDLLITVTNFFRDPQMYDTIEKFLLPQLFKNRKPNDPLRVWIPGCATGEEAVSIAITIVEFLKENAMTTPVQIFATDLNEKAIDRARTGVYNRAAVQNVSPARLKRFFIRLDGHYQVIKSIRDMCVFATHNLLQDPPFSRIDIISCQNVLIYLESFPQSKIMHSFHYSLKPDGYMILGKSETIGNVTDLFESASKTTKLYTKKNVRSLPRLDLAPRTLPAQKNFAPNTADLPRPANTEIDLDKETDKLLLNKYTPPSVLVNKDLEILRFRGNTSRYLQPAAGKASLHLLKMIREDICFDLRTVVHRAKTEGKAVDKTGILLSDSSALLTIEVIPVTGEKNNKYFLILFREKENDLVPEINTTPKTRGLAAVNKRLSTLEDQLKEARETIRIMTEDFEATREELQSSHEEVLSSNEELQSINEELETSKEELQSTNEELTTINDELNIRNAELKESVEYSKAVIETMHECVLMLSPDLRIRNANKAFYSTFNLLPEETEGKNLFEVGNGQWNIPELKKQLSLVQTRDIPFTNFELSHNFKDVGEKDLLLNSHKLKFKEKHDSMILLGIKDLNNENGHPRRKSPVKH